MTIYLQTAGDEAAFVNIQVPEQADPTLHLAGRLTRLLIVLAAERQRTAADGWPPEAQGWLSREQIGKLIGDLTGHPLGAEIVSAYGYELKQAILKAFRDADPEQPVPEILQMVPGKGWRIADGVHIEIRPRSSESPPDVAQASSAGTNR